MLFSSIPVGGRGMSAKGYLHLYQDNTLKDFQLVTH